MTSTRRALVALALLALPGVAVAVACGGGGDPGVVFDGGPTRCPAVPTLGAPPWSPPADAAGPCDPEAMELLRTSLREGATPSFAELEARVREIADGGGAACAACVFTPAESPLWGPVVTNDAGAAFVNYGACYARAEGGGAACGKAVHEQVACVNEVCTVEACRPEGLRGCAQAALQQEFGCGRFGVATACGASLTSLTTACRTAADVVRVACAAPIDPDAGGNP